MAVGETLISRSNQNSPRTCTVYQVPDMRLVYQVPGTCLRARIHLLSEAHVSCFALLNLCPQNDLRARVFPGTATSQDMELRLGRIP